MKYIDLFCGIGGFHQALDSLGHECVLSCDSDKKCRDVYKNNYGIEPYPDIKLLDEKALPDFDILCGGFPCQPFSNGGNKKSFNDSRGLLFDEIIRIAKYCKPKFIILENVKHIKKVSNGEVFSYILKQLDDIGYNVETFLMSPHTYGIPQLRERIYFVCTLKELQITNIKLNNEIITPNIFDKNIDSKYYVQDDIKNVLIAWDNFIKIFDVNEKISPTILIHEYFKNYNEEELSKLVKWKKDYINKNKPLLDKYKSQISSWYEKYKDILSKRQIYSQLDWQVGKIKNNDSIFNYYIQIRQSGIRVKKPDYLPTLVAINQTPIYAKERRYLTPRECARLQSFPDTFILDSNDKVSYKQLGNAVNVYNAKTIIRSVLEYHQQ
jgi:DNA (cytosine-5)-methyltransferase 1